MRKRYTLSFLSVATACMGGSGNPDYARVVPSAEALEIRVPSQGANGERRYAGIGERAAFYQLTREISRGVNGTIAVILLGLEWIVSQPPTSVDSEQAVWGPGTPTLSPLTYLLVVEAANDDGAYPYALMAKPRASGDDAYVTILSGASTVWFDGIEGSMTIDLNAAHALDSYEHPGIGVIATEYDTRTDPRRVRVSFSEVAFDGEDPWNGEYEYTENADRSGTFEFGALADFDDDEGDAEELLAVASHWNAEGAGRSDAAAVGGDIPEGFVVQATECWDTAFARSYYTDNIGSGEQGDAASCVFSEPAEVSFD